MSYVGQAWWVTGASSGIGAALAGELGARGAKVILSGRDEGRLAGVAQRVGTDTLSIPFDVRDHAAVLAATERAVEWSGGIDGFAVADGQREIFVAEGMEAALLEMRRTPEELFDQVEAMVAGGYMENLEADD